MALTHDELNQIAKRWLLRPQSGKGPGCKVAFVEVSAVGDGERADAWGYRWGWRACSVLVESKVSRSDFLADRKKPHRQSGGMGDFRYFICPEGVINIGDLPDRWGLLWVNKRGHVKVMAGHIACIITGGYGPARDLYLNWQHDADKDVERGLLAYMFMRVGDPDALLQQQRSYLRLNQRQADQITQLEKEARAFGHVRYRMSRLLEENGLERPEWFNQWVKNEEIMC